MTRSTVSTVFAIATAIVALWPLTAVFQWYGINVGTLEQMSRTDPLGFRVVPALLLFVRPALATAAAIAALHASWAVVSSHPLKTSAVFLKAAIWMMSLTLLLVLSGPPVNAMLARLLPQYENRHTPGAFVRPGDFVLLQEAASAGIVPPLFGIAVGCASVALITRRSIKVLRGGTDPASGGATLP